MKNQEQRDAGANPRWWSNQKVIEATAHWANPMNIYSSGEEFRKARGKLWMEYIKEIKHRKATDPNWQPSSAPKNPVKPLPFDGDPTLWTREQVIIGSKSLINYRSLGPDATEESVIQARGKLWAWWCKNHRRIAQMAKDDLYMECRNCYERGLEPGIIARVCKVSEVQLMAWAHRDKWIRPGPSKHSRATDFRVALDSLQKADEQVAAIEEAEAERMPDTLRDLKDQDHLLQVTETQMAKIPLAKWPKVFKLRIGRLTLRQLRRIERMDEDELIDPAVVKTIRDIASVAEKMDNAVAETPVIKKNSLLSASVMFGMVALPSKDDGKEEKVIEATEIPVDSAPQN